MIWSGEPLNKYLTIIAWEDATALYCERRNNFLPVPFHPAPTTQIIPREMAQPKEKKKKEKKSKYLRKRNINEEILLKKSIHLIFFPLYYGAFYNGKIT